MKDFLLTVGFSCELCAIHILVAALLGAAICFAIMRGLHHG
jgi:hypothetical protein